MPDTFLARGDVRLSRGILHTDELMVSYKRLMPDALGLERNTVHNRKSKNRWCSIKAHVDKTGAVKMKFVEALG